MQELNAHQKDQKLEQGFKKPDPGNKRILITIGVAALLLAAIWIWKNSEINNIKTNAESDYQGLKAQAVKSIVASHEEHLKLLVKPYVWAVRAEMMRGNINQVNLYALDMIKEKNIMAIAIANDSGMIVSSTNKKDEGKPFTSIGEGAALKNNDTMVENTADSVLTVTSPVMGFNKRLGTLFIKYAVQLPDLNKSN